jgi:hypothetical protein
MSTKLMPLYANMLQYKQQSNDDRDEDEIVTDLLNQYDGDYHKYLRFVLFPDVYEPCRPPTIFPHPTHIFRDIGSINLTATGGGLYLAWSPFMRASGGQLRSLLTTWNASNTITGTGQIGAVVTGEVETSFIPPVVTGVDIEHIRGLAAFIQVTYIGRLDELSGVMEVGVAIEDGLNSGNSSATRYISTAALKGLYQYKKMDVAQGTRCVYLPLSVGNLEAIGAQSNSDANLNQTYHIHITGCSTSANVFRVDYGYYYDGIVDETGFNTLLPKRSSKARYSQESVVKVLHNNMDNASITIANPKDQGVVSSIWNNVKNHFRSEVGNFGKFMLGEGIDIIRSGTFLK